MQYHYAIAEGAIFRPLRWVDTAGEDFELSNEMEMFRHAGKGGWEMVTVLVSGKTGGYRQYYFRQGTPYATSADSERTNMAVA